MDLTDSHIRRTQNYDTEQIKELYFNAFPEEDLLPLVQELYQDKINVLSFAFDEHNNIIGHIYFTECHIADYSLKLALLGPIAVTREKQKQGIGSLLINYGLHYLSNNNFEKVLVLGDPNYYGRFGFIQEQNIQPAYPIPKEWQSAWQSIALSEKIANCKGQLLVPKPWQNSKLWSD